MKSSELIYGLGLQLQSFQQRGLKKKLRVNADPEMDDEYLMGDDLLVAPVVAGQSERAVYLPSGEWFDFWTGQRFAGKQQIMVQVPLERIPLFCKSGAILPLAQPTLYTEAPDAWRLSVRVYGDGARSTILFEEDGSWKPDAAAVQLKWDNTNRTGQLVRSAPSTPAAAYTVVEWTHVP